MPPAPHRLGGHSVQNDSGAPPGTARQSASLVHGAAQEQAARQVVVPAASVLQLQLSGASAGPQKTRGRSVAPAPAGQTRGVSVTHPGWVHPLPVGQQGSKWPVGQGTGHGWTHVSPSQTSVSQQGMSTSHASPRSLQLPPQLPFTHFTDPQQSQSVSHGPDWRQQRNSALPLHSASAQMWPSQH